ncbi:MAG: 7TM domain-containing protein [Candidatus Gracilibacteria bacterium]|nr:7TM domain-containing protein [Candidatus Gracilibacteria bacterium]
MKNILIFILLLLTNIMYSYAENNEERIKKVYINNTDINIDSEDIIEKNIKLGEELIIDLEVLKEALIKEYDSKIDFEWSLEGNTIKKGSLYKKEFEQYGNKDLSLNIYSTDKKGKKLIINKTIKLFIYKDINYLILDNKYIKEDKIDLYIEKANNEGVFTNILIKSNEKDLKQENIIKKILSNNIHISHKYITVLGNKNFIFSTISQLSKEIKDSNSDIKINLVLISPFNTDVLKNYIQNFISNKAWIEYILLLPESSKSQIWLNPSNINDLEENLKIKEYEYININKDSKISEILFISKFINSLSNNGISNIYIYLIILIPFLFTLISIFKHLVGLTPIGIIIPIGLTLLLFQIGIISTSIIFFGLIIINLILGKLTNKYTLLYTPKISFIIIINLVVIMLLLDILFMYDLIYINISDTLFIILFIVISERFISVVLSKEFSEYKYNLLNTILFALVSYLIFSISYIQTITLAYPEIILILIPINFIIGKFTGLRITEYFRFKEIIKSIEE